MSFFHRFPETDFNQSNLDWIISEMSDLKNIAKTFEQSAEQSTAAASVALDAAARANAAVNDVISNAELALTESQSANATALAVSTKVDTLEQHIAEITAIPPVHSVLMFEDDTNPNSIYAGTQWIRLGNNKYIRAAYDGIAAGETGGAASQTVTPEITVESHALSVAEMPAHGHEGMHTIEGLTESAEQYYKILHESAQGAAYFGCFTTTEAEGDRFVTGISGSGAAHTHDASSAAITVSIEPEYIAFNVWIRRA